MKWSNSPPAIRSPPSPSTGAVSAIEASEISFRHIYFVDADLIAGYKYLVALRFVRGDFLPVEVHAVCITWCNSFIFQFIWGKTGVRGRGIL